MKWILIIALLITFPIAFAETNVQQIPPSELQRSSKGRVFNPDVGANFLGLFQRGTALSDDRSQVPHNGFSMQEAELQLNSDVDPYSRAAVLLSIHQESGSEEFVIDPEEIYLESISLPFVTIRAGKMKLAMGKHNQLHTHAFPFIDAPIVHQQLLGDEGLNETGLSAAVLVPVSWYSEVLVQAFNPSNEDLFNSPKSGDIGGLGHLKNLWDLSEDLTVELGISGTTGKNQLDRSSTVIGTDLTFKWRPSIKGRYRSLIWSTEYLSGDRRGFIDATSGESTQKLGGLATWLQYQFGERWWLQGRYEYSGLPRSDAVPFQTRQSALLGFFPSEFSGVRLQYDRTTTQGIGTPDHTFALQYNVSIGAHPAHAY